MRIRKHTDHAQAPRRHAVADGLSSSLRVVFLALLILTWLGLLLLIAYSLSVYSAVVYFVLDIVGLIVALVLANRQDNSTFRIAWIILILTLPIFGLLLFLAWGRVDFNRRERGRFQTVFPPSFALLPPAAEAVQQLQQQCPSAMPYAHRLQQAGYPVYNRTEASYFPMGEQCFKQMEKDIAAAKDYVFIEYFIIATGQVWDHFHRLLLDKLAQGVKVRILFDDVGCFFKLPPHFDQVLRKEGFEVAVFNPAHRFVSNFYMNYRNHQKIVVIDGKIAYTGGINLADEYANLTHPHGHWKDNGIRLQGAAVRSMTVLFLQMWNLSCSRVDPDFSLYLHEEPQLQAKGFCVPYADGPANNPDNPAVDILTRAAGSAQHTLWLTTPYLVLDDRLSSILQLAAHSGVDVRIITPAQCDHWYVGLVNRHNYRAFLQAGVKIYEYTPGFIHAKMMLVDDDIATVGTVNLDHRSLYLHYENGVWLCRCPAVEDIRRDLEDTLAQCTEITSDIVSAYPWYRKLIGSICQLFSPLM